MKRFAITTSMLMTLAAPAGADQAACAKASEDAQNLRDDGKLLHARKDFLECSSEQCPASIRKDCVESLAKLEANIPTLVFTAKDAQGRDLTIVTVKSDGAVVAAKIDGKAVPVDPGPHTLRFEAAGEAPLEQSIVVREGEKNRAVAASWEKHAVDAQQQKTGSSHVPAFIVGGLGIAALAVGTTFAVIGTNGFNDLKNGCGKTTSCTDSDVAPTKTQLLVADISFGVGIAALVTAVILFVTESSSSASARAHLVVPGLGAFGVGGTF